MRALLLLTSLLLLTTSCGVVTGTRTPMQVTTVVDQAEREARSLAAAGDWINARRVAAVLERVRPDLPLHAELRQATPPEIEARLQPGLLGANLPLRLEREASLGRRVLYWLPDRLLDVFDLVSLDVSLGPGLGANVHLTRWAAFGLGAHAGIGAGWHEGRSLGLQVKNEHGFSLPGYSQGALYGFAHGSGPSRLGASRFAGCPCTNTELHRSWRDPWALGAEAHLLLVGASVDVHPLELVDLLTGIFGFDWLGDDLATTSAAPELSREAFLHMQTLAEIALDVETLNDYDAFLAAQASADG